MLATGRQTAQAVFRQFDEPHLTQSFEQLPRASKITHAASLFRRRGLPGHAPGGQRAGDGGDHSTRARPLETSTS